MSLNQHVQERAYQELSSLHQLTSRLPKLSDRPNLPYVSALVQEIWRWNPSVPLGLPHMTREGNVYRGMKIEKGSFVWANIWSILHDEKVFPDPFSFNPERYLDGSGLGDAAKQRETVKVAFGLGRRFAFNLCSVFRC